MTTNFETVSRGTIRVTYTDEQRDFLKKDRIRSHEQLEEELAKAMGGSLVYSTGCCGSLVSHARSAGSSSRNIRGPQPSPDVGQAVTLMRRPLGAVRSVASA
jgi:hypothetical protein